MKSRWTVVLLCVFGLSVAPAIAAAAPGAAQFATQSVFLSRQSVSAGESVFVHASIVNPSDAVFSGKVIFRDNAAEIGRVTVSLAVGEARVVSISWQPSSGSHTVTASLADTEGEQISGSANVQTAEIFSITEAAAPQDTPSPSAGNSAASARDAAQTASAALGSLSSLLSPDTSTAPVENSSDLADTISSFVPSASSTVAETLSTVDTARTAMTKTLNKQISSAASHVPFIIASSTSDKDQAHLSASAGSIPQKIFHWFVNVLWTLSLYVLIALRHIVTTVALFYPVAALLFAWGMYALYKRMTRPRWEY